MSDQRPEIQRWELQLDEGFCTCEMQKSEPGEYVLHSDHLRHLTLAKIEVLEELPVRVVGDGPACLDTDCDRWVSRKIAALRKELEHE